MAVDDCLKHAKFGDVKLFTDKDLGRETVPVKFKNVDEAARFTTYKMPYYIKTSHILFVQYDSWIIDPGMWRDEFLRYDYVGAPWWYNDNMNVGNSGFNLRSVALLKFIAEHEQEFPLKMPEDQVLCRGYRTKLPQFKWAPESVAIDFSFERSRPSIESRHFGFHGMFNWPFVLSPDKMAERMNIARRDPHVQKSGALDELDIIGRSLWVKTLSGVHRSVEMPTGETMCDAAE
jgi:hypothetical protein